MSASTGTTRRRAAAEATIGFALGVPAVQGVTLLGAGSTSQVLDGW